MIDQLLKEKGYSPHACGRVLDQGDLAWNSGETDAGTPCSMIVCQCQQCLEDVFTFYSWYSPIDDIDELYDVIRRDLKARPA